MKSVKGPSLKVGFSKKLEHFKETILNKKLLKQREKLKKVRIKNKKRKKDRYILWDPFCYEEYFDLEEGRNSVEFENYSGRFNPDKFDYFVYDVKNKENGQISLKFFFDGSLGKWEGEAHYLLEIKFIGIIVCDDVVELRKKEYTGENVMFKITKDKLSGNKILDIENNEVGTIYIECKKLYAKQFEAYAQGEDGKWSVYEG